MTPQRLLAALLAMLVASIPITFAAELHLTYDANGNLVTGDGKYRVYNSLNQLSAVYNGTNSTGTLLETYIYHPTEERILKRVAYNPDGSINETVTYLSQTYVRITNSTGTYDEQFVYHNGQLVAQTINGSTLFIHGDHKGSTSVVTNASGTVVERDDYAPFGAPLNNSVVRYGYEGKEADTLVGDTDFHARKYRADLGIFTTPDDRFTNAYDPQNLNRYLFERGNPIKNQDNTGHITLASETVQNAEKQITQAANDYIVQPATQVWNSFTYHREVKGVYDATASDWVNLYNEGAWELIHAGNKEAGLDTPQQEAAMSQRREDALWSGASIGIGFLAPQSKAGTAIKDTFGYVSMGYAYATGKNLLQSSYDTINDLLSGNNYLWNPHAQASNANQPISTARDSPSTSNGGSNDWITWSSNAIGNGGYCSINGGDAWSGGWSGGDGSWGGDAGDYSWGGW